jgi:integrase
MARLKIRYFVAKGGDRGTRYYWQPAAKLNAGGWRTVRLPDDRQGAILEAEKLNAALDAWRNGTAEAGAPAGARTASAAGTVARLIEAYRASAEFKALAPKTRHGYDYTLGIVGEWAGPEAWSAITPRAVATLYRELAEETPAKAAATVRTVSLLWSWGRRHLERFPADNPAARQKLKAPERGGPLWSPEAVAAFAAAADRARVPSLGTAVVLNEWLGQREGDVIALQRSAYAGGVISLRQSKRGAAVDLPIDLVPRLKLRLEAELDRRAYDDGEGRPSTTLLVNEATGRPWEENAFRKAFARVRTAAVAALRGAGDGTCADALERLTFMRLRHTAVTRLAEAGCTQSVIAAVTGHTEASIATIIEVYRVRTRALAASAFRARLERERGEAS